MGFILSVAIAVVSTFLCLKYLDYLDYYKKDKRTERIRYIGFVAGIISIIPTFINYEINELLFGWIVNGPFLYHFLDLIGQF